MSNASRPIRHAAELDRGQPHPLVLERPNAELASVRDAMRELNRMIDALEEGELDKIVLTRRNRMRAVLITLERYTELEQRAP